MPEVREIKPATTKEEEEKKRKEEERKKKELSEEEKQVIMMGDNFQKFFDRATRIVERALSEDINVFVDYAGGGQHLLLAPKNTQTLESGTDTIPARGSRY